MKTISTTIDNTGSSPEAAGPLDSAEGALTVAKFCQVFEIGRTTAYSQIASGALDARKIGARTLISKASAAEWWARLPTWKASTK